METVFSTLIGAFITGVVSRYYYMRAAKELQQEADELRRLTTLVLRAMENAGWANLNRDASGRIMGLVIRASGHLRGTGSLSAHAEVLRSEPIDHAVRNTNDAT
jgi:hypothetical protein